ncbi:septal ring lytic transglycosylase RlpA family protein [Halomonas sp. MCCC 1A11062]|uniref:septal ring lytic transglycosylase RlpA family protein n=1 Tax=Halomonas sp. MCCC 1A11062 TaxID=2733485 RepID=UPI001F234060|nr:septal ring lytic transglycosylase RlpA family protein [Halomonas sp. MCCC 1A11062]MCE8038419.1 septal ring lytic transglycosylase RlpA family protein [Halomonas sp. MCCC 1A11062]
MMRVALVLFMSVLIAGCAGRGSGHAERVSAPSGWNGEQGKASFYADRYHGRKTASGERHDRNALTAAHRSLPFGTHVRVTRLDNGRETVVRINDRGPFVRGRVIDVSRRAAEELDMIGPGVVNVRLTPE